MISLHILVNFGLQLTKAPKKTDKKNVLVWYQTSASQSIPALPSLSFPVNVTRNE